MQGSNRARSMGAPMPLQVKAPLPDRRGPITSLVRSQTARHISVDVAEVIRDAANNRLLRRNRDRVEDLAVQVEGETLGGCKHSTPHVLGQRRNVVRSCDFGRRPGAWQI